MTRQPMEDAPKDRRILIEYERCYMSAYGSARPVREGGTKIIEAIWFSSWWFEWNGHETPAHLIYLPLGWWERPESCLHLNK